MNNHFEDGPAISLPQNFAQSVLQLEMQMEFQQSSTLTVVQQLNELYRIAIQHYINYGDERKLQHFQRKLQILLTHPRTLQAIQNKNDRPKDTRQYIAHQYGKTLKNQMNKFNQQSRVLVKSMMDGSEIKLERTHRLVSQHIENQEEKLRRRMESRSKSKCDAQKLR